jgi:hypothetical protein
MPATIRLTIDIPTLSLCPEPTEEDIRTALKANLKFLHNEFGPKRAYIDFEVISAVVNGIEYGDGDE